MHLLSGPRVTGLNQLPVLWSCTFLSISKWHLMICEIIPLRFLSNCFLEGDATNEIN